MKSKNIIQKNLLRWVPDILIILVVLLLLFPFFWIFLTSIKPSKEIITLKLKIFPSKATFEHYKRVFQALPLLKYIINSLIVASGSSVLALVIATTAAYSVSRFRFKGRGFTMLLFLTLNMFPVVLLLVPLYIIFLKLGILDTHLSLIIAYSTYSIPFSCWMLTGYFNSIPNELEESAMIDGCSHTGAFVRIILPLAISALTATLIYVFIYAWNEFVFAVVFTRSLNSRTLAVGLSTLIGQHVLNWGMLAAGGVVSSIPVIILFMFIQKSMVSGIAAGAVKG